MVQINGDGLTVKMAVDGREVVASLLSATLQRVFGATLGEPRSWLSAYRNHAARINHAVIMKGRRHAGEDHLTLHDDDFKSAH